MARLQTLLVVATLLFTFADAGTTTLQPNRLYGWKDKWSANNVELEKNNRQASGIYITFRFHVSTSMTNGVMNVIFPDGFDPVGATCTGCTVSNQQVTVTGMTFTPGTDQTLVISGITNPIDKGGYGPFQLITRYHTGGQIIDINKNFGSIYITDTAGTLSNLNVAFAQDGTTNNRVGTMNNNLEFTFQLNQDLWKHDVFQITIGEYFTIGTNAECHSVKQSGIWNHFNSTDTTDIHNLNCAVEAKTAGEPQTVYIYGLSNDIDLSIHDDYSKVKINLNRVTNPAGKYAETQYNWTVETIRFQTRTVIEQASTNGQPAVTHGLITAADYYHAWGFDETNLTKDHETFMEVKFTPENYVDDNGSAEITLTDSLQWWGSTLDDDTNVVHNCFIVSAKYRDDGTTPTTCARTSASVVTITGIGSAVATSIKEIHFRVLVEFTQNGGTEAGISSIVTKLSDGTEVDKATTDLPKFMLSNNVENCSEVEITFGETGDGFSSVQAGGPDDTKGTSEYFKLLHKPNSSWDADTVGKFYLPINQNSLSESEFYLNNATGQQLAISYSNTKGTAYDCQSSTKNGLTGGGDNHVTPSVTDSTSTDIGNIQFKGGDYMPLFSDYVVLCYNNANANQPNGAPTVAANIATKYEGWIDVSTTAAPGFVRYIGFTGPINVKARTYKNDPSTSTAACNSGVYGQIAHTFADIDKIDVPGLSSDRTYYLDIRYKAGGSSQDRYENLMGSGLDSGDDYPVHSDLVPALTATITDARDGTFEAVRVKLTANLSDGDIMDVMFPISIPTGGANGVGTGASDAAVNIFYTQDGDPRVNWQHYYQPIPSWTSLTDNTAFTFQTSTIATSFANGESFSSTIALKSAGGRDSNDGDFVLVVLPVGFTVESPVMRYDGVNYKNILTFTSLDRRFKYPSIFGETPGDTTGLIVDAADKDLVIGTLKARIGNQNGTTNRAILNGAADTACQSQAFVDWQAKEDQENNFTIDNVSVSSTPKRAANHYEISVTVSFTCNVGVPAGGSILLTTANNWTRDAALTTCSGSGFVDFDSNTPSKCEYDTSDYKVDDFSTISAGTILQITVDRLLVPNVAPSTIDFLSDLKSYDENGNLIELWDNTRTDTEIDITENTTVNGLSTDHQWTANPPNAGLTDVDLKLSFGVTNAVSVDGIVEITIPLAWKLTGNDIKDNCFSSVMYYTCTYSSGTLRLEISEAISAGEQVEIYLENAVDVANAAGTSTDGFRLETSWSGITIDQDPTLISTDQKFTTQSALTDTITPSNTNSIVNYPKNAGDLATYSFTFKSSRDFISGNKFKVAFPSEFDPFVGNSWVMFENEPNNYYIDCDSSQLGTALCQVDRGDVIITGTSEIQANTDITINIHEVYNPAYSALGTGHIKIGHMDSSNNYIAYNQSFGTAFTTDLPENITVRSVKASSQNLYDDNVDYSFQIYVPTSITISHEIQVLFPKQFDLFINDGLTKYTCTTSYLDDSDSGVVKSEQDWNNKTECPVNGNRVTYPPPSVTKAFTSSDIVTIDIKAIGNPEFGEQRTAEQLWDFDDSDFDAFTEYDVFSDKFQFFVYDTTSTVMQYELKSYFNMNSAYLGYKQDSRSISIGGYDPQDMTGRILVIPGSTTDEITISLGSNGRPMAAKNVRLTPSTNARTPDSGKLSFVSSFHDYRIFQGYTSMKFRVGAAIDTPQGLYYVNWTLEEERNDGANKDIYSRPDRTLIEVTGKQSNKFTFQVDLMDSPLIVGTTSVPIGIHIANPPASDVTVNIELNGGNDEFILVSPLALTFLSTDTVKYFDITISESYDLTTAFSQSLTLSLSGSDDYVYKLDKTSYQLTIQNPTEATENNGVASWTQDAPCGQTTCSVRPIIPDVGVLYWVLQVEKETTDELKCSAAESFIKTLPGLVDKNDSNGFVTYQEQLAQEYKATEVHPVDETWVEFQKRLFREHSEKTYYGATNQYALDQDVQLDFSMLFASTSYQVCGQTVNVYGTRSAMSFTTFTTDVQDTAQPWFITFSGDPPENFATAINDIVSFYQGVNPSRNVYQEVVKSTVNSRRLQVKSTTFKYIMYPSRNQGSPDTADLATVKSDQYQQMKTELESLTNLSLSNQSNDTKLALIVPAWLSNPTLIMNTQDSLTLRMMSTTEGETACIAVKDDSTDYESQIANRPSAQQVYLGLDNQNAPTPSTVVTTDTSLTVQEVEISGLEPSTSYYIFCTAVDDQPLWPTHMVYTETEPIEYMKASTTSVMSDSDEDDDFAALLENQVIVTLLLVMAFIFN